MDLLTQGLLGSTCAQLVSKKDEYRIATGVGFFSGLLADADIFIQSTSDPLLSIEYHRHFTHSIFFIPIGAFIASLIFLPFFNKHISFKRLYILCLAGYCLSGFIDACTSYGTYLLWPVYDHRISFNIISIVDPVFTAILLVSVIFTWKAKASQVPKYALLFCGLYLITATIQHNRAVNFAHDIAKNRGDVIEKIVVKPTFGNIILWRSVYISNDYIYVDAVRPGLFRNKIYFGDSIKKYIPGTDATKINSQSLLFKDIIRFESLSDGFIAIDPRFDDILGDMRYSLLPTSTHTLWGIKLNQNNQDTHAEYLFFRELSTENRQKFLSMLLGETL